MRKLILPLLLLAPLPALAQESILSEPVPSLELTGAICEIENRGIRESFTRDWSRARRHLSRISVVGKRLHIWATRPGAPAPDARRLREELEEILNTSGSTAICRTGSSSADELTARCEISARGSVVSYAFEIRRDGTPFPEDATIGGSAFVGDMTATFQIGMGATPGDPRRSLRIDRLILGVPPGRTGLRFDLDPDLDSELAFEAALNAHQTQRGATPVCGPETLRGPVGRSITDSDSAAGPLRFTAGSGEHQDRSHPASAAL